MAFKASIVGDVVDQCVLALVVVHTKISGIYEGRQYQHKHASFDNCIRHLPRTTSPNFPYICLCVTFSKTFSMHICYALLYRYIYIYTVPPIICANNYNQPYLFTARCFCMSSIYLIQHQAQQVDVPKICSHYRFLSIFSTNQLNQFHGKFANEHTLKNTYQKNSLFSLYIFTRNLNCVVKSPLLI